MRSLIVIVLLYSFYGTDLICLQRIMAIILSIILIRKIFYVLEGFVLALGQNYKTKQNYSNLPKQDALYYVTVTPRQHINSF